MGFIPIPSHSRVKVPIPVPELHYVHIHSHGIPMGKWEMGIPIPDAGLSSYLIWSLHAMHRAVKQNIADIIISALW